MMSENEQENEKRDTIVNILAEYRNDADAMDRGALYRPTTEYLRRLLDRIEAAWKREREELDKRISDLEAYAKLWTGRADELRLKCDEFYAKAKPVGSAAAMREAFEDVLEKIDRWRTDGVMEHWQYSQLFDIADAALSYPPRNCDVGTAEEQGERCMAQFDQWRRKGDGKKLITAIMEWAQMPYEEEGGAK